MKFDIKALNPEQLKPVLDTEGAVFVTAGAGSGKTRLLTHRIAHIVEHLGVAPYRILALTFTNKAAEEMRARLFDMMNGAADLWVMTFHSLCMRILRRDIERLGYKSNFSIYGDAETDRTIKAILANYDNLDDDFQKTVRWHIGNAKNNGLSPDDYYKDISYQKNADLIVEVYQKYSEQLKKSNALDFDDLLVKTLELLHNYDEVLHYYQDKFLYIHVDEFQDTNNIQYQIIKMLAAKYKNIFAVGDEDQSIYGWRGANFRNIFEFCQDFECKLYKLEQNYRSTKKILEVANRVIAFNTERMPKNLWTENDSGVRVETYIAANEGAEADFVVGTINALVDFSGYKYSDFAVLMRINALTRSFEERFAYYNIAHKIFGGHKFYDRKEIKDLTAYLRLISNPQDRESLSRIINFPKRGIGEAAVTQFFAYCDIENKPLMETILDIKNNEDLPKALVKKLSSFSEIMSEFYAAAQTKTLPELLQYIINALELKDVYCSQSEEDINRLLNIDDFLASVQQFYQGNPQASLDDYLQAISLFSDTDDYDSQRDCVNIATIHAAKGLEFKVVFIVGVEDGIFPLSRASSSAELEEERRLMYVAITRAKQRLYLTRADTRFLYGSRKISRPSRFWAEVRGEKEKQQTFRYEDEEFLAGEVKYKPAFVSSSGAVEQKNIATKSFAVGTKVRHKKFGDGKIVSLSGEGKNAFALIEFSSVGKLTLAISYAPLEIID